MFERFSIPHYRHLTKVIAFFYTSIAAAEELTISWSDNSSNENGFIIERADDSTNFQIIATTAENVTSYTDDNTEADISYSYRVKAYNEHGESGFTNTITTRSETAYYSGVIEGIANGHFGVQLKKGGGVNIIGSSGNGSLVVSSNTFLTPSGAFTFESSDLGTFNGFLEGKTITAASQSGSITFIGDKMIQADWLESVDPGYFHSAIPFSRGDVTKTLILPDGNVFASTSHNGANYGGRSSLIANTISVDLGPRIALNLIFDQTKTQLDGNLTTDEGDFELMGTGSSCSLSNVSIRARAGSGDQTIWPWLGSSLPSFSILNSLKIGLTRILFLPPKMLRFVT